MQKTVPSIGVLVIEKDNVLLVKHTPKAAHLTGTYGLPAGRLEPNEELVDGAARELKEETGLVAQKEDLLHLPRVFYAEIERKGGEIVKFKWDVFVAVSFSGELKESDETIPEWVKISEVSKLNLLPNTENAIREGLKLLNNV